MSLKDLKNVWTKLKLFVIKLVVYLILQEFFNYS